ncbi:MAG: peptidoglycan editing factor PgeF [Candidatus Kapaibacterium sp.]
MLHNEAFKTDRPEIFPKDRILSGVTHRNEKIFPQTGFSIFPSKLLDADGLVKHRSYFADFLGIDIDNIKFQKQVHEDRIRRVDKNSPIEESDGMITDEKGIALNITIADCCAVLVYDPVNEAIGAFHSGWRGTALNISPKGINMMITEFGSNPGDILVYLSACASGENYEVGAEVAEKFSKGKIRKEKGKYLLDIKETIIDSLKEIGIKQENIEYSSSCTISDNQYHSYRRDKDLSGRMAAYIMMKA